MGRKNIRYAARLLFADPRLIPVLMLESDVPEFALPQELLQATLLTFLCAMWLLLALLVSIHLGALDLAMGSPRG